MPSFFIKKGRSRIVENIILYVAIVRGGALLFLIRIDAVETAMVLIIIARLGEIFDSLLNIREEASITIYVECRNLFKGFLE